MNIKRISFLKELLFISFSLTILEGSISSAFANYVLERNISHSESWKKDIKQLIYAPYSAWNAPNNPLRLDSEFKVKMADLPIKGEVKEKPWADSYWPSNKGGVAYRWMRSGLRSIFRTNDDQFPFHYEPYSEDEVKKLSFQEMATLSPAEKYDILKGDFSYPTVKKEKARTNAALPEWYGLCHGLAPASLNFKEEPKPVTLKSPQGISIPFGASDVKALLIYYQGHLTLSPTRFIGTRCENNPNSLDEPECEDINAGSFHVVLSNFIGIQNKSFIGDVERGQEVWNFPIIAYESKVIKEENGASPGAAEGTVKEMEVRTKITYASATYPQWERARLEVERASYLYRLEINDKGDIIGGTWLSQERPDFIWLQDLPKFEGYYGDIEKIYKESIKANDTSDNDRNNDRDNDGDNDRDNDGDDGRDNDNNNRLFRDPIANIL